jgi:hypothetical protein
MSVILILLVISGVSHLVAIVSDGSTYLYTAKDSWTEIATGGPTGLVNVIKNAAGDKLYGYNSSDGKIYEFGGASWTAISGVMFSEKNLGWFNSKLYAVTENLGDDTIGVKVWEWQGGTTWNQINITSFGEPPDGFGEYSQVGGVPWVYNGDLYVATIANPISPSIGMQVWKWAGSGTSWAKVNTDGFGDSTIAGPGGMVNSGGFWYMGTAIKFEGYGFSARAPMVWKYSGSAWVNTGELSGGVDSDGDDLNQKITQLEDIGGIIYAGVYAYNRGESTEKASSVWKLLSGTWTIVGLAGFGEGDGGAFPIYSLLPDSSNRLWVSTYAPFYWDTATSAWIKADSGLPTGPYSLTLTLSGSDLFGVKQGHVYKIILSQPSDASLIIIRDRNERQWKDPEMDASKDIPKYQLVAQDYAGNKSTPIGLKVPSSPSSVPSDTNPPYWPTGATAWIVQSTPNLANSSLIVHWSIAAIDAEGNMLGYRVTLYKDGVLYTPLPSGIPNPRSWPVPTILQLGFGMLPTGAGGTPYVYTATVEPFDRSHNYGTPLSTSSGTPGNPPDTTPPDVPSGLSAGANGLVISARCDANTTNSDWNGNEWFCDQDTNPPTTSRAKGANNSFVFNAPAPGTYYIAVRAYDANGNLSAKCTAISITVSNAAPGTIADIYSPWARTNSVTTAHQKIGAGTIDVTIPAGKVGLLGSCSVIGGSGDPSTIKIIDGSSNEFLVDSSDYYASSSYIGRQATSKNDTCYLQAGWTLRLSVAGASPKMASCWVTIFDYDPTLEVVIEKVRDQGGGGEVYYTVPSGKKLNLIYMWTNDAGWQDLLVDWTGVGDAYHFSDSCTRNNPYSNWRKFGYGITVGARICAKPTDGGGGSTSEYVYFIGWLV